MNRGIPATSPTSDSDDTLSGCDLALKSRDQAFLVPSRRAHPDSGLSPASAPARLLLRRPTPCAVKGGAKHRNEERGGHGHSRFPRHAERARQPKPRQEYAVPRYRVTLVRENRALPPSLPLTTSVTAASILRPLFVGLDREQFLVCGLEAKHAIIGVKVLAIG